MSELLFGTQGALQSARAFIGDVPFWLALLVIAAPTLLSTLTRSSSVISLTVALSITCVLLSASYGETAALPLTILALCGTAVMSVILVHNRGRANGYAEMRSHICRLEELLAASYTNAQERSNILDQEAEDVRTAFSEAQVAFDRMRRRFSRIREAIDAIQTSQQSLEKKLSALTAKQAEEVPRRSREKDAESDAKPLPLVPPSLVRKSAVSE